MCRGCWEQAGSPTIDNYKVKAAAKLIADVYDSDDPRPGGSWHIVFDDYNVEIENIYWVMGHELGDTEAELGRLFLDMTEAERMSAVSLYHNLWRI